MSIPSRRGRRAGGRRIAALLIMLGLTPLIFAALPVGFASASTTATTTAISTASASTYFASASLSVTVTASGGNPTTGTVAITDSFGDFSCTDTLSGTNVATCSTGYTKVGTDAISATYEANSSYGTSTGTASATVSKATVTLAASATAATVGQTTTVTVQATPAIGQNTSGALSITDSVSALDCTTALSSGFSARCTSSAFTSIATDDITVSWAGNSDFNPVGTSATLDVGQAATLVASVTASPGQVGGTATITVQVQPTPDGGAVSVTDHDGQVSGCTALTVNTSTGQASCTTPTLTAADANDMISASYLGDTNYAASSIGTGNLDIARGATQLAVTGDPGPSAGSSATYVATVTPSAAVSDGGNVAISDTSSKVTDCTNLAVGSASCESLTYSSVGSDTVSATFAGNANWAPAAGSTTFSVAQGQPNVTVTASPTNPTVGEQVTISAVVSPTDGGGAVAFSGSYISGCNSVALTGNTARCTTSTLSATGNWTVTATYSGDANYSSTGTFKTVTITAAPVTVTTGATNSTPVAFAADTLTATVRPIPDGGTVDFVDSNGTISGCGSVAINATTGIATCVVAELHGAGTYNVTATYSGGANYLSNSGQLALGIAKIPSTILVTAAANPVTVGQTTTLTITISPVPDGGSATVTDSFGDLTCSGVAIATSGAQAGKTTCVTRALSPAGTDSLTTSFTGTSNYLAASGSGSITVNRIASTTTVTSADPYGVVGGQLHVSVTVSPVPTGGSVSFSDSLNQLGVCATEPVNPSTGIASCTSGTLTATGQDTVSATFQQSPTEASSSVSVIIPIDEAPAFSGSLTFTESTGSPSNATIQTIGYPTPSVTAGAVLPSGLSLSSSGVISGVPAFGSGGVYSVPVTAANALNSASVTITFVVDQVPAITSVTSLQAAYGVPVSFVVTTAARTYPTPTYTLSGGMPAGLGFGDSHDGTATIEGTPTNGISGPQSFSLVVSNSAGTITVPFSIDVTGTPVPSLPTTTTTPSSSGSNSTPLSPLVEALSIHRSEAVASAGKQPAIRVRGVLPSTWDPIAKKRTVHHDGKVTTTPIVKLGSDSRFPVLGNVGPYGDCAVVADSNIVRVDHLLGKVTSVPKMTTNEALSEWSAINGGSGEGLTDSQLLHAWSGSAGVLGTRVRGWHELDPQNISAIKEAIKASGALYAGIILPADGVVGDTIDPVLSAATEVSGHGLAIFGWTPEGLLGISWGQVVVIPYSWWNEYSTTAYAVNIVKPAVHS